MEWIGKEGRRGEERRDERWKEKKGRGDGKRGRREERRRKISHVLLVN